MKKNKIREWNDISMDLRPKVRYWVPAAAMDEEDLKLEIRLLKERGFGGIEVVMLSEMPEEILIGDDGWGTENWNHMIQVMAGTTQELGMTMDLANGPMWPISMPTVKDADDPAALRELTFGILECPESGYYKGALPERRTRRAEGTPQLVHVMAYLETADKVLKQESYHDLSSCVRGHGGDSVLECWLPKAEAGTRWLIFAFYSQPAVHKTDMEQYYVVDHLSRAGAKACEEYWDSVMEKYDYPSMESFFCDSLEYASMMDWTPLFPEEFEKRRGYSILPYLPFVGLKLFYPDSEIPGYRLENKEISDMLDRDYRETLTQCYCENHLAMLEKMAEKYGKSIRYQVAYNKPFEGERCPLYIEIPENEALGRPAMDYQKTMAAAVHLGRKKRYSFECAAEFGNCYGQTYEDLMWWVKRSFMSGMNAQVLHGASYNGGYHGKYALDGKMRGVKWPGYEGFGKAISNYWNRTLSVEDARGCLDAIARLNSVFRKKAKVDCAIYRQSYENDGLGSEFCFYPDDGALMNAGYSYETISTYLLNLPTCKVEDGRLDKDGVGYKCLIVPETDHVSTEFLEKVLELLQQGFSIVWIGNCPIYGEYYQEWKNIVARMKWKVLMDQVWNEEHLCHVREKSEVPAALKQRGILPDVQPEGGGDIVTAAHIDEENNIRYYALYAYNRVKYTPETPNPDEFSCSALYKKGTTKGSYQRPGSVSRRNFTVTLKGEGAVYYCNFWSGSTETIPCVSKNGYTTLHLSIEEDELILLALFENEQTDIIEMKEEVAEIPIQWDTLELSEFVPDSPDEISFFHSHFMKEKKHFLLHELKPWRALDIRLKHFVGQGTYYGSILLSEKKDGKHYLLCLGNVSDTFQVVVNGQKAAFPNQTLKRVDVTELLHTGVNQIKIEVFSNLYNRLLKNGDDSNLPFDVPYVEKDYGIWESEGKKCVLMEY